MTLALLAAGTGVAAIQMYEPVLFGRVIDSLTRRHGSRSLLILWAELGLANVMMSVFVAVMADRLSHRQRLTVIGTLFERVISWPFRLHAEQGSTRLVRIILKGTDTLFTVWLSFFREHFPALLQLIVLIPFAMQIDIRLANLLIVLGAIYLIGNSILLSRTRGGQAHVENFHQDLFGRVGDVIGNVTVVQSYTRLQDEANALRELMAQLLNAQYPVLTWWGLLTIMTRVSSTVTLVAIVGYGSILASRGEITVGEIVSFTGFSGILIAKLDQLSTFVSYMVGQIPTVGSMFELLDRQLGTEESPNAIPLIEPQGHVQFHHVTYQYPTSAGQGVFDLDFKVTPGHTVALVGPSGSGKTTALALLQRIYDPQKGRIEIDGTDIRDLTLSSLRSNIAAVFQDSGLFNRSIEENIRIGRPSATIQEVEEAAIRAEAHDFIMQKPGGYRFVIGERGSALSGGERQRLAIARAILKNAPILIFDEATSALDNETERKIEAALIFLRTNRTTFVIAHRLSTIIDADIILVFEKGRIVESGTFDSLKSRQGLFSKLLAAGRLNLEPTQQAAPTT